MKRSGLGIPGHVKIYCLGKVQFRLGISVRY